MCLSCCHINDEKILGVAINFTILADRVTCAEKKIVERVKSLLVLHGRGVIK